jgi:lysozyme
MIRQMENRSAMFRNTLQHVLNAVVLILVAVIGSALWSYASGKLTASATSAGSPSHVTKGLSLLAALASGIEVGFNLYATGAVPMLVLIAAVVSFGAAVARVIAQPGLLDDKPKRRVNKQSGAATTGGKVAAGAAGVMLIAVSFVAGWEGKRNTTYNDIVGIPTICYGQTGARAVPGRTVSDATCQQWLEEELGQYYAGVRECIRAPMQDHQAAAFTSLAYNIGVKGFCGSTAAKRANAGDWPGACAAIERWNMAGGSVVNGLVRRRAAERKLCEGRA